MFRESRLQLPHPVIGLAFIKLFKVFTAHHNKQRAAATVFVDIKNAFVQLRLFIKIGQKAWVGVQRGDPRPSYTDCSGNCDKRKGLGHAAGYCTVGGFLQPWGFVLDTAVQERGENGICTHQCRHSAHGAADAKLVQGLGLDKDQTEKPQQGCQRCPGRRWQCMGNGCPHPSSMVSTVHIAPVGGEENHMRQRQDKNNNTQIGCQNADGNTHQALQGKCQHRSSRAGHKRARHHTERAKDRKNNQRTQKDSA